MQKDLKRYIEELRTITMTKNSEKNKFLSIESYNCYLNNGKIITREKLLKNKESGSAVIIYPVTSDNKVILAIEPRVFTKETVGINLPAGYIEKGEYPYYAAKRELQEETGYNSDNIIYLGSYYQDEGVSGAYNYYFLALNARKISEQNLDKDEFIKYILVTQEEVDELLERGLISGINSAFTTLKAKSYLKRRWSIWNLM